MDFRIILGYVVQLLRQPSTYAGISLFTMATGNHTGLSEETQATLATGGAVVATLLSDTFGIEKSN